MLNEKQHQSDKNRTVFDYGEGGCGGPEWQVLSLSCHGVTYIMSQHIKKKKN